jgi:hypothetical protein
VKQFLATKNCVTINEINDLEAESDAFDGNAGIFFKRYMNHGREYGRTSL